jgi:hypothetical protein
MLTALLLAVTPVTCSFDGSSGSAGGIGDQIGESNIRNKSTGAEPIGGRCRDREAKPAFYAHPANGPDL